MEFVAEFTRIFVVGIFYASPVLLGLAAAIALVGLWIGRREGWARSDALYYAFITATTVGYGDFRPTVKSCKLAAICIALIGLVMTGVIVAIGVKAASLAFETLLPRVFGASVVGAGVVGA